MVEDLNLYSNEPTRSIYIRSIYDSRFDGCGFTWASFSEAITDTIFSSTTFRNCIFNCRINSAKFFGYRFEDCMFTGDIQNCNFDNSLIKGCIFKNCKIYGTDKDNLFSARSITNPAFIDCKLPEYIVHDYTVRYADGHGKVHTTIYLFVQSGKLITKDGMIDMNQIDRYDELSKEEIDEIDCYSMLPTEKLLELNKERNEKLAELVLKGIDAK
jgi:uncharacterized protein YjbI with pentapeptide repeats